MAASLAEALDAADPELEADSVDLVSVELLAVDDFSLVDADSDSLDDPDSVPLADAELSSVELPVSVSPAWA